jgi:hypothetical protein
VDDVRDRDVRAGRLRDLLLRTASFKTALTTRCAQPIRIADLATRGFDPRTERSLSEAIESYRRAVLLAASSLLDAAVEGAWYAAGQRLRSTAPQVDALVDGDRTAQLQGAVAAALRDALPGNRRWEADALSQFARLMRDIRN